MKLLKPSKVRTEADRTALAQAVTEELERQINEIYKDDEASISRRLNKARMDMEIAPLFRNIVYNDDTDKAFEQIKKVVMAELEKRRDE